MGKVTNENIREPQANPLTNNICDAWHFIEDSDFSHYLLSLIISVGNLQRSIYVNPEECCSVCQCVEATNSSGNVFLQKM